jgi:glyoxylase-like metal-dependent hydrolase (beta-lactamase superfamily II)
MKIKTFPVNPFEMNCYVYYDEDTKDGVIIDPGAYTDDEKETIAGFIDSQGIKIKYILNTHGHIDHIMGNKWAKDTFSATGGVPLIMHKGDLELVHRATEQGKLFGVDFPEPPEPDKFVTESDEIVFGNCLLKVIQAPGHSPGGVCFVDEKERVMFVGDCVFKSSIGRTDLWGGDMDTLIDSIKNKIFRYGDDYVLYPGHYEETTIGEEKKSNPFL